jgi:hypothetical protein
VAALAFVVGTLGWLLHRHTDTAGSNTVSPRYPLPGLAAGQQLCLRGLTLPADADGMTLQLGAPPGPAVPVTMRLGAAGRTQVSHAVVPGGTAGSEFRFAAPGRDVPASACLTTSGTLADTSGLPASQISGDAYLDGQNIGSLAIRYLRLPSRSVLSALPDATHRAALFRAGFVGPWTYLALALLVVAAWIGGLSLLLREAS